MPDVAGALALGRVLEVEIDEKGLHAKVQRLDRAPGVVSDWITVASPMAGPECGVLFAPEPDDIAVIGQVGERPLILGFITGASAGAAAQEVEERTIASRDKNMIVLIDGSSSGITIKDSNDNSIVMDKNGITVKSAGEITIEAGGTCAVKGATVELN
jgi:hypothetical protein